jgi:hypothetical protein
VEVLIVAVVGLLFAVGEAAATTTEGFVVLFFNADTSIFSMEDKTTLGIPLDGFVIVITGWCSLPSCCTVNGVAGFVDEVAGVSDAGITFVSSSFF